jgi:beta-mannosidase
VATSEGLHIVSSADLAEAGLPLYPCVVPGNFELDLCANGIFNGDPLFGKNIVELRKYETYHVWYVRRFDIRDVGSDRAVLVFEGIDCIADIYLNGTWVGATDNMLIEHEFDITDSLQPENEIVVHIHPAGERAAEYAYPPAVVTMPHLVDSTYIRKAPHSYGWDIMPRALSAGLWRPVSLDIRPGERIDWLYLANTEIEKDLSSATLMLRYTLDLPLNLYEDYEIQVSGRCGDSVFSARSRLLYKSGLLEIRVSEPALWWPRGRGAANLYDVTVQLMKRGTDIDTRSFRHGIRTVRLDRTDITDSEGHGEFCFYVNHERVFAKGTNWVPVDVYHSRDAERIPRILEQVEDIGCNMIRCWGGNVYENDLFYDLCDEKGILVWQDFIMACSVYPQDDAFRRRLAEEARSAIRRLRQHACLTLWAGDNECDDAWLGSPMHLDPNDNALTRTVLPDVLREEDPFRPYLPSSPYISRQNVILGQSSMPEAHLWGSRHDHRSDYFKQANCHFVSEVGVLSCPPVSSIRKFIPEESLWPFRDNAFWTLHATSPIPGVDLFDYRVHLLAQQVTTLFGRLPDNLEDFVFATQVSQAEAMKSIIERFRSQMWRRTGVLWWNIMDGWPQFSDAVVDYYFERKLAYEFIKRAQEPLCLVIREEEDRSLVLVAVNDTREECRVQYCVSDVQSNEVIAAGEAIASADSAVVLSCLPCPGSESGMYRIRWTYAGTTGMNHFLYGRTTHDLGTYRRLLSESYSTADAVSVEAPSWD